MSEQLRTAFGTQQYHGLPGGAPAGAFGATSPSSHQETSPEKSGKHAASAPELVSTAAPHPLETSSVAGSPADPTTDPTAGARSDPSQEQEDSPADPETIEAALADHTTAVETLAQARVALETAEQRYRNQGEGSSARVTEPGEAQAALDEAELGIYGARTVLDDLGVDPDAPVIDKADLRARPRLLGGSPGHRLASGDTGFRDGARRMGRGPLPGNAPRPAYWRGTPASASDEQRIRYAAAAAVFERRLGEYLSTREAPLRELRRAARIAWAHLSARYPERLTQLGVEKGSGDAGAVGRDPAVLRKVVHGGNLREVFNLLETAARNGALEDIVPAPRRIPEISAERKLAVTGESVLTWQLPHEVRPPLSAAEDAFSVRRDPTTGEKKLLWRRAEDRRSMPLSADLHQRGQDTGALVGTGTSGSTALMLESVRNLAASVGWSVDFQEVRLGILGFLLSAGHHSLHEVMRSAQLWDEALGQEYGLGYVDGWSRYRHLGPLTEQELRDNVAQDGLFPDEIALGVRDPYVDVTSVATGIDMLRARRVDPAHWAAELDSTAVGLPPQNLLDRPGFPADRLQAWSAHWSATMLLANLREEEASLRTSGRAPDGRALKSAAGEAWLRSTFSLDHAEQDRRFKARELKYWGLSPEDLSGRLRNWIAGYRPHTVRPQRTTATVNDLTGLPQRSLRIQDPSAVPGPSTQRPWSPILWFEVNRELLRLGWRSTLIDDATAQRLADALPLLTRRQPEHVVGAEIAQRIVSGRPVRSYGAGQSQNGHLTVVGTSGSGISSAYRPEHVHGMVRRAETDSPDVESGAGPSYGWSVLIARRQERALGVEPWETELSGADRDSVAEAITILQAFNHFPPSIGHEQPEMAARAEQYQALEEVARALREDGPDAAEAVAHAIAVQRGAAWRYADTEDHVPQIATSEPLPMEGAEQDLDHERAIFEQLLGAHYHADPAAHTAARAAVVRLREALRVVWTPGDTSAPAALAAAERQSADVGPSLPEGWAATAESGRGAVTTVGSDSLLRADLTAAVTLELARLRGQAGQVPVDGDEVMRLHATLSDTERRGVLRERAEIIARTMLTGGKTLIPGGAKKKKKPKDPSQAGPSTEAQTPETAPAPVSEETVQAVRAALGQLGQHHSRQELQQIFSMTLELLPKIAYPADRPVADLVRAVEWVVTGKNNDLKERLLKYPHIVYSLVQQPYLKRYFHHRPEIVDLLGEAPGVLENLVGVSAKWHDHQTEKIVEILSRKDVIQGLESDPALRMQVFAFPNRMQNLNGEIDVIRASVDARGSVVDLLEIAPNFGAALLSTQNPVEALWGIGGEAGLLSALLTQVFRRREGSKDFYGRILADENLRSSLREFGKLYNVLLSAPELLDAVRTNRRAVEKLDGSPLLTDVLEDLPGVAVRLLADERLITAAVDNAHVAKALSYNPHRYDAVEGGQLLDALKETESPAPSAPAAGLRAPLADIEKKKVPALLAYLRRENPAIEAALVGPGGKEVTTNLLNRENLVRLLAHHPQFIAQPHVLRRISDPRTSRVIFSSNDSLMLFVLASAGRHWGINALYSHTANTSQRLHFDGLLASPSIFRQRVYTDSATAVLAYYDQRVIEFLEEGYLRGNPWAAGVVANVPTIISVIKVGGEKIEEIMVAEDSALLRLLYRRPAISKGFPFGQWLTVRENLVAAAGVLPRLLPHAGRVPAVHWMRLLIDGGLLRTLGERIGQPTAEALFAHPDVLREAIARPGFTDAWIAEPERFDAPAGQALRAGGKGSTGALLEAVRAAGELRFTADGELDVKLTARVRELVAGISRGDARNKMRETLRAGGGELVDSNAVLSRYVTVKENRRLSDAVQSSPYLAQVVLFRQGMLELLVVRPSILGLFDRSPDVLRQVVRVEGLARLLTNDDNAFGVFVENIHVRQNYYEKWVRIVERNPQYLKAYVRRDGELMLPSAKGVHVLVSTSASAARAVADRAETFTTLVHSRPLVEVLETAGEGVVRAVMVTQGRLDGSAQDSSLLTALGAVPGLAEVLGDRPEVAADAGQWRELLGNVDLMRQFSEHPAVVGDVLDPAVLPVALAAPAFVTALARVSAGARGGLTRPVVLELVARQPRLAGALAEGEGLRAAVAGLRGLAELLLGRSDVVEAFLKGPGLIDAVRANRTLIDDAASESPVWLVIRRHPALTPFVNSSFRNVLRRYPDLVSALVAHEGDLDRESAGILRRALTRHGVPPLLAADAGFAKSFLGSPAWQLRAIEDNLFSATVRRLSGTAGFGDLVADPDPGRLLGALDEVLGSGSQVAAAVRPAIRQARDSGRGEGPAAPVVTAGAVQELPAATAASPFGPDNAPLLPAELTDLLGGQHASQVADALARHAELLPLLTAVPAVAEEIGRHPERLGTYVIREFLDEDAADTSFDRQFDAFLESVDIAPGQQYAAVKAGAAVTWRGMVEERQERLSARSRERAERFGDFRADAQRTWEHSGRIRYAGRLGPDDFTAVQQQTLERVARWAEGVREASGVRRINTPLHAHLDSGSGGVAFFYALAPDGQVDLVVFARSGVRQGNSYRWGNSGQYVDGPPALETVANDPGLRESRSLVENRVAHATVTAGPASQSDGSNRATAVERDVTARAQGLAQAVTEYHASLDALSGPRSGTREQAVGRLIAAGSALRGLGADVFARAGETLPQETVESADALWRARSAGRGAEDDTWQDGSEYERGAIALALHTAGEAAGTHAAQILAPSRSLTSPDEPPAVDYQPAPVAGREAATGTGTEAERERERKADVLTGADRERVRAAFRVWSEPITTEVEKLVTALIAAGGGARSLVLPQGFGSDEAKPLYAVNVRGDVRWYAADSRAVATAPPDNVGAVRSMDLDAHGTLLAPTPELQAMGVGAASFPTLRLGADLLRELGLDAEGGRVPGRATWLDEDPHANPMAAPRAAYGMWQGPQGVTALTAGREEAAALDDMYGPAAEPKRVKDEER
ncbi:hypothetical protein [Streptomyces sp. NPDC048473]|uniref:hypothetical protein n=1 Tax=unclassified Streptomyces TaxID=2593676 RepID=UPI0037103812